MSVSKDDHALMKVETDLQHVRADIDKLDQVILKAIEDRANLAAEVSKAKGGKHTFRPGREANLIRQIAKQSHLPAKMIEQVWRVIIAHNLTNQAGLRITVKNDAETIAAAQFRFGTDCSMLEIDRADDVISSVANGDAQLGIVPHWHIDEGWLSTLAAHQNKGDAVYITAFTHMHDGLDLQQSVILSSVLPDASTADMTVVMADDGVSLREGYHLDAAGLLGIFQICDIS